MVDWANSVESRNQGILRRSDRRYILDLLLHLLPAVLFFSVLFFYSWIHSRMEAIAYAESDLQNQEQGLLRERGNLTIEEEWLKNPERIDRIARVELNMEPAGANQVVPMGYPGAGFRPEARLALANEPGIAVTPRKP